MLSNSPNRARVAFRIFIPLRQLSALIALIAVVSMPVSVLAQTKDQERGIGITAAPQDKSAAATPASSNDKPALILQTGHTRSATAVAFSHDNRWLASGGKDNVIKIWDLANGNILRTLYGHSSNVNALAVSPDGKLLASGSGNVNDKRDLWTFTQGGVVGGADDTSVRIWNIQTGQQLQVLRGHALPVGAVAFSNDGQSLTSVGGDAIKVWNVAAGTETRSQKTQYGKSGMEKLDVLDIGCFIGCENKQKKQEAQRLKNFKMSASKIAVSSNGQFAAVGQPDKAIKIYDAAAGREVRELPFKTIPEAENSSLAFSPDARLVAFAKTSDTVSVQESSTGREVYSVITGPSKSPQRVQFSADGRFLITATDKSGDAGLKLWDATTGQSIRELIPGGEPLLNPRVISFSRDGSLIATVGAGVKAIKIIDAATGHEVRTLQTEKIDAGSRAEQAAFIKTIDAKTMAKLQERDITTPEQIIEAVEAMGTISSEKLQSGSAVSFSPDGRFLVSNHIFLKNLVTEVWDSAAGTLVRGKGDATLRDRGKPFFSPDGRFRAAAFYAMKDVYHMSAGDFLNPWGSSYKDVYKQRIDIYDGTSDKRLRELDGGKGPEMGIVPAAGFSFDGKLIAMTGFEKKDRSVIIFESESGRKVKSFPINDDVQSGAVTTLCLSADARLLAAGYATKIDLFEAATGKTLRTIAHPERVVSLTFSPDGRFLVALGANNEKYIWDAASGEKLATLVNLGGTLNSRGSDWLVVTPDGLFDGSPAAWKQILWQFGGNTFDVTPAETFFNEFYYPGLLAEVMAGKKPRAPKNISQLDRRQPEIRLTLDQGGKGQGAKAQGSGEKGHVSAIRNPQSAISTHKHHAVLQTVTERNLRIAIDVTEKPAGKDHALASGARDVRLFRNGSLVKVWRGDVLKGKTTATLETNIAIVAGENRLEAYAFNNDNVKSRDATLNLKGADSLKRPGTAYVLAIGVNSYSNTQYNLKFAVADAAAFSEEVQREQKQIGSYANVEVATLLDGQATKENILLGLRRLSGSVENLPASAPASLQKLKATQPEDAVFIYFAGHGTAQGQRFYLLPHDLGYAGERTALNSASLQMILDHSISDEELERAVEGIDADKLLMVIDACNSGQALEAAEQRRGPMNSKGLAQLAYEKGMYILTAAQSYQAAQETSQLGHGLLTYALVEEGLKQIAADSEPKDGEVGVREWFDYASARVPNMQIEKMKQARSVGITLSFTESKSNEGVPELERRVTQTPRVFYRRESEGRPLIVAKR
ncbi:MAG TPA: caspase family protein [Pyrinomonadaceae bacterium]|nr:caspase family protein [Pyrinomonadaceae bacterium]